jgi:hypothetical protein
VSLPSFFLQMECLPGSLKLHHFQQDQRKRLHCSRKPSIITTRKITKKLPGFSIRHTQEDSAFVEAYILKGDIISEQQKPREAIVQYKRGIHANPDFSPVLYFIVANVELMTGLYSDARNDYLKFLSYSDQPKDKQEKANRNIKSCDFGINSMAHPVPFKPVNLGDSINSPYDDYMNAVTADEQELFLTRKLPRTHHAANESTEFNEDFYKSVKTDSVWRKAVNLGQPINTEENEGALCISPDGKYIFFAACNRPDSYGSCDLYWSRKTGEEWSNPENMGPVVNSSAWDSQPSFSSDGKTLYFASKREGGKGSSDIWKTDPPTGWIMERSGKPWRFNKYKV